VLIKPLVYYIIYNTTYYITKNFILKFLFVGTKSQISSVVKFVEYKFCKLIYYL
jgi:hypothetical protein